MKVRNILLSTAALSLSAGTLFASEIRLFAAGVKPGDATSYYNINQTGPTCWAAAASNVVAHWQDHLAGKLPEGTPTGTSVYDTFFGVYQVQSGGHSHTFYQWWLGHHSAAALGGNLFKPGFEELGGYYEEIYTTKEAVADIAWKFTDEFWATQPEALWTTELSRAIYYALSNGHAMAINIPNDQHAITVYGATFDPATELVTSLYVCDSSGASFREADYGMERIRVGVRGNYLCLLGYYMSDVTFDGYDSGKYLEDVYFLGNSLTETLAFVRSGIAIPEPSAFGMLAGVGSLALTVSRRRRERLFAENGRRGF